MNDITFNPQKFNEAKNKLKEFSEKIPANYGLEHVETSYMGFINRDVTGRELNDRLVQIQAYLTDNNKNLVDTIKEFGFVYNALESLDKEYIQKIILTIKIAEEASCRAQDAAEEAKKNTQDIKKTIEIQKKTINILTQFKEKIDKYKHIASIDEIWKDSQTLKKDIEYLVNNFWGGNKQFVRNYLE